MSYWVPVVPVPAKAPVVEPYVATWKVVPNGGTNVVWASRVPPKLALPLMLTDPLVAGPVTSTPSTPVEPTVSEPPSCNGAPLRRSKVPLSSNTGVVTVRLPPVPGSDVNVPLLVNVPPTTSAESALPHPVELRVIDPSFTSAPGALIDVPNEQPTPSIEIDEPDAT